MICLTPGFPLLDRRKGYEQEYSKDPLCFFNTVCSQSKQGITACSITVHPVVISLNLKNVVRNKYDYEIYDLYNY